jgi:hypothetical protein
MPPLPDVSPALAAAGNKGVSRGIDEKTRRVERTRRARLGL